MATCGCGQTLPAATPLDEGPGISLDGSLLNTGVTVSAHDALAWVQFTPVVGNFTLGDALTSCRYLITGKNMDINWNIWFQSTSTWTASEFQFGMPPGTPSFSLPQYSTSSIYQDHQMVGDWSIYDQNVNQFWSGYVFLGGSPLSLPFRLRTGNDSGGSSATASVRQGTPITFTVGDQMSINTRVELT